MATSTAKATILIRGRMASPYSVKPLAFGLDGISFAYLGNVRNLPKPMRLTSGHRLSDAQSRKPYGIVLGNVSFPPQIAPYRTGNERPDSGPRPPSCPLSSVGR